MNISSLYLQGSHLLKLLSIIDVVLFAIIYSASGPLKPITTTKCNSYKLWLWYLNIPAGRINNFKAHIKISRLRWALWLDFSMKYPLVSSDSIISMHALLSARWSWKCVYMYVWFSSPLSLFLSKGNTAMQIMVSILVYWNSDKSWITQSAIFSLSCRGEHFIPVPLL